LSTWEQKYLAPNFKFCHKNSVDLPVKPSLRPETAVLVQLCTPNCEGCQMVYFQSQKNPFLVYFGEPCTYWKCCYIYEFYGHMGYYTYIWYNL
jgi:hypothetical protein